jgi:secernin
MAAFYGRYAGAMCDSLCVTGNGRTLFAKNSDRPPDEAQVVEAFGRRNPGGTLRTQYLDIDDAGAFALIGSRPVWLWGFEHGVNEHRVAIGNEAVYTTVSAATSPSALIGMDLVRLGLERGRSAREAVDVMTALLERHGQAGDCYEDGGTYHSSFLVADPRESWVLETAGRTWVAKRFPDRAAISNRLSLRVDWDLSSDDVAPGADFDAYRAPTVDTSFADVRLEASRACLTRGVTDPRDLIAHLRDHGPDDEGLTDDVFSVCMHIRGVANTTAAMVADLPEDPDEPLRAWVALGSPCASVFIPIFPPDDVPKELGDEETWRRCAALRDRVEAKPSELGTISDRFGAIEAELWAQAEERRSAPSFDSVSAALDELL